jgi:hypothetical protein
VARHRPNLRRHHFGQPLIQVEKQGFAIVPEVFTRSDIERLDECLIRNPLVRSRAGMRHALRHPDVLAVARDPRLLNIARQFSDVIHFRSGPRYLTSLPPPIGSCCGIRTLRCRCESAGTFQAGDLGQ